MEVGNGEQLGLPVCEPVACGGALALRAMPVAAAVVGDDGVTAAIVLTARDMPAESGCSAALDGTHHLHLAEAHMAAVGITPSATVIAEDVRDLQRGTRHAWRRLRRYLVARRVLGLLALRPARHRQLIERALDGRDQAGRNARVAGRRLQLL